MVGYAYLGVLVVAAVGVFVVSLPGLAVSTLTTTVVLTLLFGLAKQVPVAVAPGGGATLATAIGIMAVMSGTASGMLAAAAGGATAVLMEKRAFGRRALMEIAVAALAVAAAGLTYTRLGGPVPVNPDFVFALPAAAATAAYVAAMLLLTRIGALVGAPGPAKEGWPAVVAHLCLGLIGVCAAHAVAAAPIPVVGDIASAVGVAWLVVRTRALQLRAERELASAVRTRIASGAVARPTTRGLLPTVAQVADTLDRYNQQHGERAMFLAAATARRLGLDERTVAVAEMAALLHDIGKINLPRQVLDKQGVLTPEEREIVQRHPSLSAEMVESVVELADDIITAVRNHHERFDGRGYPNEVAGEQVPVTAQIAGVVEAYQAMVSDRPYRRAIEHEAALEELRRESGTKFDPAVVEAFIASCEAAEAGKTGHRAPVPADEKPLVLVEA